MDEIILEIKEQVALDYGVELKMPTYWAYAMLLTSRTKKQLDLYDEVIRRVYLLNKDGNNTGS